ncbi:MAG: HAMP domain-containing protein [Desulfobacteraceae bacterium]|nr:MAG: HAMP domain-containing protein [Desulfobacteraceae bacterium]
MLTRKNRRKSIPSISEDEIKRRKREYLIIIGIIIFFPILTFFETRIIHFGGDFPISNTVLMFSLININLLLLILLIFLVFRNLVKLLYDRRRRITGAKLRTRLVVAFISLSLLPTTVLFFFAINFITTSIEFWFNVPVEQALENSLAVGRHLYDHVEDNNLFFLERAAYQISTKKYLSPDKQKAFTRYIQVVQREFNHHAVEVYDANAKRLTYSLSPLLEKKGLPVLTPEKILKEAPNGNIKSISEEIPLGELIRTVGSVPYGASRLDTVGYVVISKVISGDLSRNMESISRGFEEYQQIKMLKRPIQTTYYISLSIVALLVLFCAIWFGFYLAKSITIPIMRLAEGTRRVAEGDLSFNIEQIADDEIGSLVNSFNKMTRDLRVGREQLELSARMLHEQNDEIEEQRQYMEIVLKNVSAGVISLNKGGFITTINKSAEKMLSIRPDEIVGKSYKTLLKGELLELANDTMEKITNSRDNSIVLPYKLAIDGRPRSLLVHLNALKDDLDRHLGIVLVIDDLTELEKAQRMAAWREVARRIAHEVKNPLTPISLSAQRLKRKYSERVGDPIFDECTRTIIDHVDLIRNLVNEFSTFARFPGANPKPCELPPIIEETVALYREGHTNIHFDIHISDNIPKLKLDRQQIKQAMINLVDNAIASITHIESEGDINISVMHDPILNLVRLEVSDTGAGISDQEKTRLFEPYFSTKKSGMGLGLTIVSTIITDHNGLISVQDNHPRGAKFVIEIPV